MYEYTDRAIKYLDRRYIRMFGQLGTLASFDELNVTASVRSLYRELERRGRYFSASHGAHTSARTVRAALTRNGSMRCFPGMTR